MEKSEMLLILQTKQTIDRAVKFSFVKERIKFQFFFFYYYTFLKSDQKILKIVSFQ